MAAWIIPFFVGLFFGITLTGMLVFCQRGKQLSALDEHAAKISFESYQQKNLITEDFLTEDEELVVRCLDSDNLAILVHARPVGERKALNLVAADELLKRVNRAFRRARETTAVP